jgi:hypothetical protein
MASSSQEDRNAYAQSEWKTIVDMYDLKGKASHEMPVVIMARLTGIGRLRLPSWLADADLCVAHVYDTDPPTFRLMARARSMGGDAVSFWVHSTYIIPERIVPHARGIYYGP